MIAPGLRPLDRRAASRQIPTARPTPEIGAREWPRFTTLFSRLGLRPEALAELARRADRACFNFPDRIDDPEPLEAPECVFLPVYLVRAVEPGNRVRLFAYTQATEVAAADLDVTDLCERTPEVAAVVEAEQRDSAPASRRKLSAWLERRTGDASGLQQLDNGAWQVKLPSSIFGGNAALGLSTVGSFVPLNQNILHIWCEDVEVRRHALLERIDNYLSHRARPGRAGTEERVTRIADQLGRGAIDLPALRHQATDAGRTSLAAHLDTLM